MALATVTLVAGAGVAAHPSSAAEVGRIATADSVPGGSLILGTAGRGLVRWTNGQMSTIAAPGRPVGPVAVSSDGRILYATAPGQGPGVGLYQVRPGADRLVARLGKAYRYQCVPGRFTPVAGARLMVTMYNEEGDYCSPARVDLRTGRELILRDEDYGESYFSPDGRWRYLNRVWISVPGGRTVPITRASGVPVFTPGGERVAFSITTKPTDLPGLYITRPGAIGAVVSMGDLELGSTLGDLSPIAWVDGDTVLAFAPALAGGQGSALLFDVDSGQTRPVGMGVPIAYDNGLVLLKRWVSPDPAVDKALIQFVVVDVASGQERVVAGATWRESQDAMTWPPERPALDPLVVVPVGLRRSAVVSLPEASVVMLPPGAAWRVYDSAYVG